MSTLWTCGLSPGGPHSYVRWHVHRQHIKSVRARDAAIQCKSKVSSSVLVFPTSDLNASKCICSTWMPTAYWCLYGKSLSCKSIYWGPTYFNTTSKMVVFFPTTVDCSIWLNKLGIISAIHCTRKRTTSDTETCNRTVIQVGILSGKFGQYPSSPSSPTWTHLMSQQHGGTQSAWIA